MSRLSLLTNISSLTAQRNLSTSSAGLERSFTRLSSGMRINKSSDDAAGLSVASLLKADKRIYAQGIRNLNDGISYLNIAESAVSELTNVLFRIQEIAEQSANGTLSDTQRKPLQDEVTALQKEYNRIIESTRFNGMDILRGENVSVHLQAGYGELGKLTTQIGNTLISDAFEVQSAGDTIRVSTSSGGGQANGSSVIESVSADGRFLVFQSNANNLIPGISGSQVYIKNLETGELKLGSSSSNGIQGNSASSGSSISGNGQFLAFRSNASNLIPGVSGSQIYVKNLHTGELMLGSASDDGSAVTSDAGYLSADGRYLAFQSTANNVIPGVSGDQVYIKDILTGSVVLGSSNRSGQSGTGTSNGSSLSANGRFLSFQSNSSNLISGVSGWQVYVKDLFTGELTLGSSSTSGAQGNASSYEASISADGKYLAFQSNASNLIPGMGGEQVYVKNLITGELRLASSTEDWQNGSNNGSADISISADGRYVSFQSNSTNLVSGVSGWQVYRKDMQTGELELVSRSREGEADLNNGDMSNIQTPLISADGRSVYFGTASNNLVEGDTNGASGYDVFIRDLSKAGIDELSGMVVSNQSSARSTLTLAKDRLQELNLARAGIGASTARIETGISNLSIMTENIEAAASQIIDADIAEESARLVGNNILQQAGLAVLAQANKQPEITLQLLRAS